MTVQCIVLISLDRLLSSSLIFLVYPSRIQEQTPYAPIAVRMKIPVSEMLLYGKTWRVVNRSTTMMPTMIAEAITATFLLKVEDMLSVRTLSMVFHLIVV